MENKPSDLCQEEMEDLREQLREARETLEAIRHGKVDALLIATPKGDRAYTLQGADHTYRLLVETISEGALTLSPSGMILYSNRRFAEMLQKPLEQMIGSMLMDLVPLEERSSLENLLRQGNGGQTRAEINFLTAAGDPLPVQISLNALKTEDAQVLCMVVFDLTERKAKEAEILLYAKMLEQNNQDLRDFTFVASHDLQEPLRKIRSFGDMLLRRTADRLDPKSKDYVDRMKNAAERMQVLIESLLAYSRINTRQRPFEAVDLNRLVKEVLSDLEIHTRETGGRVQVERLPVVWADPSQMRQLFQNLISNGLKFHDAAPPLVLVHACSFPEKDSLPKDYCRICVKDNGIGIHEEHLGQIFKPFYRIHARSRFEGTGIGLSICKKIVERHGGSIDVTSTPGQGACFILTLPCKQDGNER